MKQQPSWSLDYQQLKRVAELGSEKGAYTWLTALPIAEHGHGFTLRKGAFWDALCLRYNWSHVASPGSVFVALKSVQNMPCLAPQERLPSQTQWGPWPLGWSPHRRLPWCNPGTSSANPVRSDILHRSCHNWRQFQAGHCSKWLLGRMIWASILWRKGTQPICPLKSDTPNGHLLQTTRTWEETQIWATSLRKWTRLLCAFDIVLYQRSSPCRNHLPLPHHSSVSHAKSVQLQQGHGAPESPPQLCPPAICHCLPPQQQIIHTPSKKNWPSNCRPRSNMSSHNSLDPIFI